MNLDRSERWIVWASIVLGVFIIIPITYNAICDQISNYNVWIESKNPANRIEDVPTSAPFTNALISEASDKACFNCNASSCMDESLVCVKTSGCSETVQCLKGCSGITFYECASSCSKQNTNSISRLAAKNMLTCQMGSCHKECFN